jgi:methyl-accepting chemotaxis protein
MIKNVRRLILLLVILAVAFFVLSIESGGKRLRWLGDFFRKTTYEAGETADLIKESSDNVRKTAKETADSVKKTGDQIKDTSEKVSRTVKRTGDKIKDTAQGVRDTAGDAADSLKDTGERISEITDTDDTDN